MCIVTGGPYENAILPWPDSEVVEVAEAVADAGGKSTASDRLVLDDGRTDCDWESDERGIDS